MNTPDFASVFGGDTGVEVRVNPSGHPKAFESIALPGAILRLEKECSQFVVQVKWETYSTSPLYLDRRFIEEEGKPAKVQRPSKDEMLKKMKSRLGTPYLWGGNWAEGISEMLLYYPPRGNIDQNTRNLWTWKGLDCSGLFFEAAGGTVPRNTSQLVYFGEPVPSLSELQPLDIIVYPGHVVFVADPLTTLESRAGKGVVFAPLKQRLAEICDQRTVVDQWRSGLDPEKYITIRRF